MKIISIFYHFSDIYGNISFYGHFNVELSIFINIAFREKYFFENMIKCTKFSFLALCGARAG